MTAGAGTVPRAAARPTTITVRHPDALALGLLLVIAGAVALYVSWDSTAFIRGDWPTMFLPNYSWLGERLRALDIPGWNPNQFSGVPFAGDPSSGWGYFLAMLVYTALPGVPATTLFIALHVLISAAAAYILARLTGLSTGGALAAGVAYAFPWLIPAAAGQVLFFHLTTWLPVALIGVELARQSGSRARRFGGLAVSGLAISQIVGAWLGQGGYYALLVVGGWVAWRTLVTPAAGWRVQDRVVAFFGIGLGSLLLGLGLSAAGLLIRLDANTRSNVAGGVYNGLSGWADTKIGLTPDVITRAIIGGFSEASWQYLGAAVVALALLAPFVATRWPPLVFWLLIAGAVIVLTLPGPTPLRTIVFAVFPYFETFHSHLPDRILLILPLPAAMLAGASADALSAGIFWPSWRHVLTLVSSLALAAGAVALERQDLISRGSFLAVVAVLAITAVALGVPATMRPVIVPLALVAVIIWDPAGRILAAGWGSQLGPQRTLRAAVDGDSDRFLHDNGAAEFLAQATLVQPGRYFGYDPALLPDIEAAGDLPPQAYRNHWLGPANWLLVENWATWFGIDDIQGYSPIQIQRYVELMDAVNGHRQEYHETDVFPDGLDSPLLDLLNTRYIVVPADAADRRDLESLTASLPTVYEDEHVLILERPTALPRAWLVHQWQQVSAGEALQELSSGGIDPRQVALLEAPGPELAPPVSSVTESASYIVREPDLLRLEVSASAPALLMLSEIWDPGWVASVDGVTSPTYLADHTLRAIAVPAGHHVVELRYQPLSLRLGVAITVVTALLIFAVWGGLVTRERRAAAVARKSP